MPPSVTPACLADRLDLPPYRRLSTKAHPSIWHGLPPQTSGLCASAQGHLGRFNPNTGKMPPSGLIRYLHLYANANAQNALERKGMIEMSVCISSPIDIRSTWPGNGKSRSGPFLWLLLSPYAVVHVLDPCVTGAGRGFEGSMVEDPDLAAAVADQLSSL